MNIYFISFHTDLIFFKSFGENESQGDNVSLNVEPVLYFTEVETKNKVSRLGLWGHV